MALHHLDKCQWIIQAVMIRDFNLIGLWYDNLHDYLIFGVVSFWNVATKLHTPLISDRSPSIMSTFGAFKRTNVH